MNKRKIYINKPKKNIDNFSLTDYSINNKILFKMKISYLSKRQIINQLKDITNYIK